MRSHRELSQTFEAARDSGNARLAQVKANPPSLLATLQDSAAKQPPVEHFESVDPKGHGGQEHRRVESFDVQGTLDAEWDGLIVQSARVSRLTGHKDTKSGQVRVLARHRRGFLFRLPGRPRRRGGRPGGPKPLG
jgi:hypothetical protein